MRSVLRPAALLLMLFTLLTGLGYPALVTGLGQLLFPTQANGSLLQVDGRLVGSALIGQAYADPRYFWGRPSATPAFPANAAASGSDNLGPSHPALRAQLTARIRALQAAGPVPAGPVPVDLVTPSASGLDPHISPAAALYQVTRVAQARHLSATQLHALVAAHTETRWLGVLGEPRVHVLRLNLALDALHP